MNYKLAIKHIKLHEYFFKNKYQIQFYNNCIIKIIMVSKKNN